MYCKSVDGKSSFIVAFQRMRHLVRAVKADKMKTTPECSVNRAVEPALRVKSDTLFIMCNLGGTTEFFVPCENKGRFFIGGKL